MSGVVEDLDGGCLALFLRALLKVEWHVENSTRAAANEYLEQDFESERAQFDTLYDCPSKQKETAEGIGRTSRLRKEGISGQPADFAADPARRSGKTGIAATDGVPACNDDVALVALGVLDHLGDDRDRKSVV